MLCGVSGDY